MKFDGAVIDEQGVKFAIVVVKASTIQFSIQRENTRRGFARYFPGIPIVLMAQNGKGTPTYHGRPDIVNFLARIHPSRIPWKSYSVN